MTVFSQQRLGVCSDCQSAVPMRASGRLREHRLGESVFEYDLTDQNPSEGFVMDQHRIGGRDYGDWCIGDGTQPEALVPIRPTKMGYKIDSLSDLDLLLIWKNLGKTSWTNDEMWDNEAGIKMNDWALTIDSELDRRHLSKR